MSTILFVNLKGGVAKTTNTVAIAETFAREGKNVLLIDADHQCTASELVLGENRLLKCEKRKKTLHDMLAAMLSDDFKASQFDTFIERGASNIKGGMENLSVLPCSIRIDDFNTNIQKARKGYHSPKEFTQIFNRRRKILNLWLNKNFDYTLVDCPPTISMQVKVLLSVADTFIIPSIPDNLSVRGCHNLMDRIRRTGIKKKGLGILWSLYRKQDKIHRRIIEEAGEGSANFSTLPPPFTTVIPNAAPIAQAFQESKNFASYSAKYTSAGARLFKQLCREIEDRLETFELK